MVKTRDGVNRYCHERILKKCWCEPAKSKTLSGMACKHCGLDWLDRGTNHPNYCSDDSPRSLLNEVVAVITTNGLYDKFEAIVAAYLSHLGLLQATADILARSGVEAWEARGDGKQDN